MDLDIAIQRIQEALDMTPVHHPDRAGQLQELGARYSEKHQRLGVIADLETAIRRIQEAFDITPIDHPHRASRLYNLGIGYSNRYERLGSTMDLDIAIQRIQEALDMTPVNHPDRAAILKYLSNRLSTRYERERMDEEDPVSNAVPAEVTVKADPGSTAVLAERVDKEDPKSDEADQLTPKDRKQSRNGFVELGTPYETDLSSSIPSEPISSADDISFTRATSIGPEGELKGGSDVQSVVSDGDDIGSQVSFRKTPQEMAARDRLAILLAENDALKALYKEVLARIGKARFVDNFRRLLKRCYLIPSATNNLEQATVSLLKTRRNRIRMAVQIADVHLPEGHEVREDAERKKLEAQDKTTYLEDWIASNSAFTFQAKSLESEEPADIDMRHNDDDQDSEGDGSMERNDDRDNAMYEMSRVTEMEKFITESKAFTNLVTNFRLLLLPASLRPLMRTVVSIP